MESVTKMKELIQEIENLEGVLRDNDNMAAFIRDSKGKVILMPLTDDESMDGVIIEHSDSTENHLLKAIAYNKERLEDAIKAKRQELSDWALGNTEKYTSTKEEL